jgi:hypothetical protein
VLKRGEFRLVAADAIAKSKILWWLVAVGRRDDRGGR